MKWWTASPYPSRCASWSPPSWACRCSSSRARPTSWHGSPHIGWFYISLSLAGAVLLLNLLVPPLNIRGLAAQRKLRGTRDGAHLDVFEDDNLAVEIRLSSRSLLPKMVIALHDDCPLRAPGDERQGYVIGVLGPRGSAVAKYQVQCYRRGLYSFGPLSVQTSAPFGLFRSRRTIEAPLEVAVYPRVLPLGGMPKQGALVTDSPSSSSPGPSGEFRGSREFSALRPAPKYSLEELRQRRKPDGEAVR